MTPFLRRIYRTMASSMDNSPVRMDRAATMAFMDSTAISVTPPPSTTTMEPLG